MRYPLDFSPSSYTGCFFYVDGDAGVTPATGKIATWADQSGRGNNAVQANTSLQPTYLNPGIRGIGSARCTGANTRMVSATATGAPLNSAGITLFAVARVTDTSADRTLCGIARGPAQNGMAMLIASGGVFTSFFDVGGNYSSGVTPSLNDYHVFAARYGSGTLTQWVDGRVANVTTGITPTVTAAAINLCVSDYVDGSGLPWRGDVDHVSMWPTLTDAQMLAANSYFRARWGI